MKILLSLKRMAAGIAAMAVAVMSCPVVGAAETEDAAIPDVTANTEETASEVPDEDTPEMLSSVTVVHTAEISEENYEPTDWWKADLEEYDDLSLVSYETVSGVISAREAEFIAEGRNDSIVSNSPTASAVSYTEPGTFAFTSYGWGHCVGMSQNGANFYAKYAGWNYQDILFHYYPGTTLMNTGTAETEIVTVQGVPGNVLQQVSEIVNNEVGPSFHPECIKAQAVAVYSYIKYNGNDGNDLRCKPNPPQSLVNLCAEVLGEALYYNGNVCLTMFYASCGGITANCYDIFYADIPYLRSVASEYDSSYDPHWGDVVYLTIDEVRNRLQKAYNITLSDNPENWIQLVEGNGGYVNRVIIDGQVTARGNSFRSVLGLKSPKFTYICNVSGAPPEDAPEAENAETAEGSMTNANIVENISPDNSTVLEETQPTQEAYAEAPQESELAPPPMPTVPDNPVEEADLTPPPLEAAQLPDWSPDF